MYQFLESIRVEGGVLHNLELHQQRVDRAVRAFMPGRKVLLDDVLTEVILPSQGLFKLRLVYGKRIKTSYTVAPYAPPTFEKFIVREVPELSYPHKFLDRRELESFQPDPQTQVLFTQEGFVTDSIFSNVVFFDGTGWFTPSRYLLGGVMRRRLLLDGAVATQSIHLNDLKGFTHFRLINALNGMDSPLRYPVEMLLG